MGFFVPWNIWISWDQETDDIHLEVQVFKPTQQTQRFLQRMFFGGRGKPPKNLGPKTPRKLVFQPKKKHCVCGSSTINTKKNVFYEFVDSTGGETWTQGSTRSKRHLLFSFLPRESPANPANVSQWHKHSKLLHASARRRSHRGQATALTTPWWPLNQMQVIQPKVTSYK